MLILLDRGSSGIVPWFTDGFSKLHASGLIYLNWYCLNLHFLPMHSGKSFVQLQDSL